MKKAVFMGTKEAIAITKEIYGDAFEYVEVEAEHVGSE